MVWLFLHPLLNQCPNKGHCDRNLAHLLKLFPITHNQSFGSSGFCLSVGVDWTGRECLRLSARSRSSRLIKISLFVCMLRSHP
jgi:hypothetical protein